MHEIIDINGLKFIFSPLDNVETASLGVFIKIGSRFEKKETKGVAHFLEHMLFKGSKKYSHLQIKREIEGRGGSLNAFTSQEITGYYAHFLQKNLKKTLDILLDMVFNPTLRLGDITKERNVILEEIKMYNDFPSSRSAAILDELLWSKHPLGQEVIGYNETVKSIKRLDLDNFRKNYYISSNMVISFSGSFDKEKIISLIKKKVKKNNKKVSLKDKSPRPLKGVHVKCENKSLEQAHLWLGFRGVSYLSSDEKNAKLMSVILGANMSSRLFEELREKKSLCYDISTEARKYKDTGAFVVHVGLDKNKIIVAVKDIISELKKMKETNVSVKELSRAKDYLLGQTAMNLERPQGRMFANAESYLTRDKVVDFKDIKSQVKAITPLDIRELANKVFNFEKICITCVGNIDKKSLEIDIKKVVKG